MSRISKEGEEPEPTRAAPAEPELLAPALSTDARALLEAGGLGPVAWSDSEELWTVTVETARWPSAVALVREGLGRELSTLFGEDARPAAIRIHAIFLGAGSVAGVHARCDLHPDRPRVPTLDTSVPFVTPFERETAEMFGVVFEGARDRRPLLLHETHPSPPMLRGASSPPSGQRAPYKFPPVEGDGVYKIPVGPVHAGVIEPGHFRFQVVGERILNLETRFGYTHKRTERLFEDLACELGTIWAESISGDMSVAGAVAYAHAVERAVGLPVPPGVERARALLLEVERIAFLCGDVAGISLDVGYGVGAAQANLLREEAYHLLGKLTGSRLGRGIVGVGGLRRPIATLSGPELLAPLGEIRERVRALHAKLLGKSSVVDRLSGTGAIPRWVAELMHFVGPTARASGLRADLRRDRPYGAYRDEEIQVPRGLTGDVEARLSVKVEEIVEACRLASRMAERGMEHAPAPCRSRASGGPDRTGLGWVESPRGELLVHVTVAPSGRLRRVHIRDPSFLNWPAIEFAVRGNIVPDFPLCNKSLNLSYSGYDR